MIDTELNKKLKKEKPDGEAAQSAFFKESYGNADEI